MMVPIEIVRQIHFSVSCTAVLAVKALLQTQCLDDDTGKWEDPYLAAVVFGPWRCLELLPKSLDFPLLIVV